MEKHNYEKQYEHPKTEGKIGAGIELGFQILFKNLINKVNKFLVKYLWEKKKRLYLMEKNSGPDELTCKCLQTYWFALQNWLLRPFLNTT